MPFDDADPRARRGVLFDWDGTLVDSAAVSYQCYVRVFSEFGIPFDRETFERTYTPEWYRTYVALGLPRDRWDEADALWTRTYTEQRSPLLPGAREALERLAGHGLRLGLVTSGDPSRVRRELETHELRPLFGDAVVCGGETERRKPDPQPLLVGLERLGLRPDEAAYVGDSPEDVLMAKTAGVLSVGIPGGFPNRSSLAASQPDIFALSLGAAVEALLTTASR